MIPEKQRRERLRRQRDLKVLYERKLDNATSDAEKKHLEARIAEVVSNIKATELPKLKALLPKITKTAEEDAKKVEEHIVHPLKTKRKSNKIKKVGNPF